MTRPRVHVEDETAVVLARLGMLTEEGAVTRLAARCINEMVEARAGEEPAEAILDRVYWLK